MACTAQFRLLTYHQHYRTLNFILLDDVVCASEKAARSQAAAIRKDRQSSVMRTEVVKVTQVDGKEQRETVVKWTYLDRNHAWTNDIHPGTLGHHGSFISQH